MSPADQWGPFAENLNDAERRARLRSLRAVAKLICGPRADALAVALREAEADPACLDHALDRLGQLPALDRRRVLASYGRI